MRLTNYEAVLVCFLVVSGELGNAQFDSGFWMKSSFGHLRNGRSIIQCTASRELRISFNRTGGLPRFTQQMIQTNPPHTKVLMLMKQANLKRVGTYACEVSSGGIATTITTLKLPPTNKAHLLPLRTYVTAHVGDTVRLSVTKQVHLNEPLVWQLGEKELPHFHDRETVVLKNVSEADGGVYECHYEGRRDQALHAFVRLHVVSCKRGKFGHDCQNECPPCRNGGVCHDAWGTCLCPPGFAGPHCDTACGPNRVGNHCDRECTTTRGDGPDPRAGCAIHVFCRPDPLGCTCAPGFRDPDCSQECPPGTFGASCRQRCRCAAGEVCDPVTGECAENGCLSGWTGDSCQIYEGSSKVTSTTEGASAHCDAGRFGTGCSRRCHCEDEEPCNPVSGACPGSCREGFARPTCSDCVHGRFGDSCSHSCHCWNGHENCRPDGTCNDGCAAGWTGLYCQDACQSGKFGPNCAYLCHCADGDAACDTASGNCTGTCRAGYVGHACQELCPQHKYGANCSRSCDCRNGGICDPVDGSCSCTGRYRGSTCIETIPQIVQSNGAEIDAGQNALLVCIVEAHPAPTVGLHLPSGPLRLFDVTTVLVGDDRYRASAVLSGSRDGSYEVTCSARNKHGLDTKVMHVEIVAAPVLNDPPEVRVSVNFAQVSWKPWKLGPGSGGRAGDAIEYQLQYRSQDVEEWKPVGDWQKELEKNVTDLLPDTEYHFAVRLRRNNGSGSEDQRTVVAQISSRTPCGEETPDSVPKELKGEALSDDEIVLTWGRPTLEELQCRLTAYELRLRKGNETVWTSFDVDAKAEEYVLDHLQPETEYTVSLRAVTSAWNGTHEATVSLRTLQGVPGQVEDVKVEAINSTSAKISWSKPAVTRGIIQDYRIAYNIVDVDTCGSVAPTDASSPLSYLTSGNTMLIGNLIPHSLYEVSISAGTAMGYGESVVLAFNTSEAAPSTSPANVKVTSVESRALSFSWDGVPCLHANGDVVAYVYVLRAANETLEPPLAGNVTENKVTVEDLVPFRVYTFQVAAATRAGTGVLSEPLFRRTAEDVPGQVAAVTVANVTQTEATLYWEEPEEPNGIITLYQITVEPSDAADPTLFSNVTVPRTDEPRLRLAGLSPGRTYAANVRAATSVGYGPDFVVEFETTIGAKKPGDADVPRIRLEHVGHDRSTVTVRLKFSGPAEPSTLDVAVRERVEQSARKQTASAPPRVVAGLSMWPNWTRLFTVGDGFYYGGFFNGPLEGNRSYDIWVVARYGRPVSSNVLSVTTDPEPDDFVVKKVADYFVPHFAIILAVSVLLVLVILFVMFYTLHRERRKRTMSCDDGASSPHDEVTEMAYYCVGDKPETAYL